MYCCVDAYVFVCWFCADATSSKSNWLRPPKIKKINANLNPGISHYFPLDIFNISEIRVKSISYISL